MKRHLLDYLRRIGMLDEVPKHNPPSGKPLASGVCPLHDDADNPRAFLVFADGFACVTHECHRDQRFGLNLEGLIRHLVFRETGEVMNWSRAWEWARRNIPRLKERLENRVHTSRSNRRVPGQPQWSGEELAACLQVPDPLFLRRGYRPETLAQFGVGRCVRELPDRKRLIGWSVFPVLGWSEMGEPPAVLGYTARNPRWTEGDPMGKWHHAVKRSACLYNQQAARKMWPDYSPLIICEGPPCVLRFHEAGFSGAVAVMGNSLTESQHFCLHSLIWERRKIFITADNDEGGEAFAADVKRKIRGAWTEGRDAQVIRAPGAKDFGDMPTAAVREWMRARLPSL